MSGFWAQGGDSSSDYSDSESSGSEVMQVKKESKSFAFVDSDSSSEEDGTRVVVSEQTRRFDELKELIMKIEDAAPPQDDLEQVNPSKYGWCVSSCARSSVHITVVAAEGALLCKLRSKRGKQSIQVAQRGLGLDGAANQGRYSCVACMALLSTNEKRFLQNHAPDFFSAIAGTVVRTNIDISLETMS